MKKRPDQLLYLGFILLLWLGHLFAPSPTLAQSEPNSVRIESEYKLSVPKNQEDNLWDFLKNELPTQLLSNYETSISEEIFYDQYFDDENFTLLQNWVGVRVRQRYIADTLAKILVQLKLPGIDTGGVARQEVKFEHYSKQKSNDRQAAFPLWKHVRPADRREVDLVLARFGLKGEQLKASTKVNQLRRRVYIAEAGLPIATFTLDRVSNYYFPYSNFTELELELNEIRFTAGSEEEKARMTALNDTIKKAILTQFPDLKQDQLPKYNKAKLMTDSSLLSKIYDVYLYLILAALGCYAFYLWQRYYWKRIKHRTTHNTPLNNNLAST